MASHEQPATRIGIGRAEPVFPAHDLEAAMQFYARLGFEIRHHDAGYGFAIREDLHIHLRASPELDLYSSYSEVYVHTEQVDALHAEWRPLGLMPVHGISDELRAELKRRSEAGEPVGLISDLVEDKPWGIREFSIRDLDNNQLRFGRPSSGGAPEENPSEQDG